MKAAGNEALKAEELDVALDIYDSALKVVAHYYSCTVVGEDVEEEELCAVAVALKNNVALTLLKKAESMEEAAGGVAAAVVYMEAAEAASKVLEFERGNVKAARMKEKAKEKACALGFKMVKSAAGGRVRGSGVGFC